MQKTTPTEMRTGALKFDLQCKVEHIEADSIEDLIAKIKVSDEKHGKPSRIMAALVYVKETNV